MTEKLLAKMRSVDPRTIDRGTLRDIRSVSIDTSQPKEARIRDYVRQVGNPYCYLHGKYVVKVSFADSGPTLEDKLASYIVSKTGTLDSLGSVR